MKIFILSDTHFGHSSLVKAGHRPYDFENIIKENLRQLKPEDLLIHLGDFCIGDEAVWHELFRKWVPCRMVLVRGNHDGKSNSWYLDKGWDFVCRKFTDKYFGQKFIFTHIPVEDVPEDTINIHGHLHNMEHREMPFELNRHKLISLEKNDYKLTELKELVSV